MVKLKNKHLCVHIDTVGAEIKSILLDGVEQLWQGEQGVFERTAPTLFPFCGALKDEKFIFGEQEYSCSKHGFAKDMEFSVLEKDRHHAVFELKSSEETKEKYPFDFAFRVVFSLLRESITVKYIVKNKGETPMYFSVGSHEAYLCEGGIENCDLIFKYKENLETYFTENSLLTGKSKKILVHSDILPIYRKFFENDSLIFKNLVSKKLILRNRTNGKRIKLEFPDFKYFVIWALPDKNFLCLEPWAGLPDNDYHTGELEKKEGIIRLRKGEKKVLAHKITFLPSL